MKLVIDTRNGIAGDIVNAGLIGLGANKQQMISSMEYAGNHVGTTKIKPTVDQGTIKLDVKIERDYDHLHESKAKELLAEIIGDLGISQFYRDIATKTLNILCDAERYVHSNDKRLQHMLHHHHREQGSEAVLHEAKDILIDVIGLSIGLRELDISEIGYLDYVNVGKGIIRFSHGEFDVPAPATEHILNKYDIHWKKLNTDGEMATPTGVSILAGCKAKRIDTLEDYLIIKKSLAKGTRGLPPISFCLMEY
jgi:hypothetical protein